MSGINNFFRSCLGIKPRTSKSNSVENNNKSGLFDANESINSSDSKSSSISQKSMNESKFKTSTALKKPINYFQNYIMSTSPEPRKSNYSRSASKNLFSKIVSKEQELQESKLMAQIKKADNYDKLQVAINNAKKIAKPSSTLKAMIGKADRIINNCRAVSAGIERSDTKPFIYAAKVLLSHATNYPFLKSFVKNATDLKKIQQSIIKSKSIKELNVAEAAAIKSCNFEHKKLIESWVETTQGNIFSKLS